MRLIINLFHAFIMGCFFCVNAPAQEWQPFTLAWNQSPVDLRFLLDAPAGKHGYLGYQKDRFVFEDNTTFHPWGVTVSGGACFPLHEQSPILADRLARMGINLVRFQNLDEPSLQPPLAQSFFPVELNKELLDKMDYFIYQLETLGIYVCFDGLQSMQLNESSGIAEWERIQPGLKSYIHFIPELQNIYAEYLSQFWTHRNRYMEGKQLRDIPNVVFAHLFHDNAILPHQLTIPTYNYELYTLWTNWLETNQLPLDAELNYDEPTPENLRFFSELTAQSYSHWHSFLRSLNVKTLIGGDSVIQNLRDLPAHWNMDFISPGGEWNLPLGKDMIVPEEPMLAVDLDQKSNLFSELAAGRLMQKPFFISGWGEPFPNRHRAELPLWAAAMTRWQNWQGAILNPIYADFDYAQSHLSSSFHYWIDPMVMGLMPSASILFHQEKLPQAKTKVTMKAAGDLFSDEQISVYDARTTRLLEQALIQVDITNIASGANVYSPTMPESIHDFAASKNPAPFQRDMSRGLLLINTPQVKAFVGGVNQAQSNDIPGLRVRSDEPFAVVCAASLNQKPLESSTEILITVVSEAKNTGMITLKNDIGISIIRLGTAPTLIKNTPCRIYLQTRFQHATVSALNADGSLGVPVPLQIQDGWVSFSAGTHGTIYYRLSCVDAK